MILIIPEVGKLRLTLAFSRNYKSSTRAPRRSRKINGVSLTNDCSFPIVLFQLLPRQELPFRNDLKNMLHFFLGEFEPFRQFTTKSETMIFKMGMDQMFHFCCMLHEYVKHECEFKRTTALDILHAISGIAPRKPNFIESVLLIPDHVQTTSTKRHVFHYC